MTAIEAHDLVRTFATGRGRRARLVRAVDGVDLHVDDGEIVAFLGPNGAGKTTTLRVLTTLLAPTAGTARVAGFDVATRPQDVRRGIGYVSQTGGAFSLARAGEEVVDRAMLYGLTRSEATRRARRLFDDLDLGGLWRRTPSRMSGGQRRRLDIVMGLVHEPRLVFLDEPTTGLDPQARANLWQHVFALRDTRGATVFLTTHYLDEADALADRIIIIDRGRIVASDTAAHLKAGLDGDLVELTVAPADVPAAAARLSRSSTAVETTDTTVRGRVVHAAETLPGLLRQLDADGVALTAIEVHRPTLDDVFLTLTGRSLRDADALRDTPTPEGAAA